MDNKEFAGKKIYPIIPISLLFMCAVISAVLITYLVINGAYRDSFELLKNQVIEIKEDIENKKDELFPPVSSAGSYDLRSKDKMIKILKGEYIWTLTEIDSSTEITCEDGESITPGNNVVIMRLDEVDDSNQVFEHIKREVDGRYMICKDEPGEDFINRTYRDDNGYLLNYHYVIPTSSNPESALTVMFEFKP